jgi:hypothetical protein
MNFSKFKFKFCIILKREEKKINKKLKEILFYFNILNFDLYIYHYEIDLLQVEYF